MSVDKGGWAVVDSRPEPDKAGSRLEWAVITSVALVVLILPLGYLNVISSGVVLGLMMACFLVAAGLSAVRLYRAWRTKNGPVILAAGFTMLIALAIIGYDVTVLV